MYSDWLAELARFSGDRVVLLDPENKREYTYQELNSRAKQLAAYFIKMGVEHGDRVALHAPNHISQFDFFFACAKIGAIFVPLNWRRRSYYLLQQLR